MQQSFYKHTIQLFLLATFLFLKVVDVHAIAHFDDEGEQIHCEYCKIITTTKHQTPFLGSSTSDLHKERFIFLTEVNTNFEYQAPLFCIAPPAFFHNKPPPFLG